MALCVKHLEFEYIDDGSSNFRCTEVDNETRVVVQIGTILQGLYLIDIGNTATTYYKTDKLKSNQMKLSGTLYFMSRYLLFRQFGTNELKYLRELK